MTAPSWREPFKDRKPSPRVRLALLLYESGTAKTKAEAAEMAGISPATMYMSTIASEPTKRLAGEIQEMIANEGIKTSEIIQRLSRKALGKMAELMDSAKDEVALRAAQDLLDRSPDMPKTQIATPTPFSLGDGDISRLAHALVESANAYAEHKDAAQGMVEVDVSGPPLKLLPKGDEDA